MVSMIENYAAIEGKIVGVNEHTAKPGFLLMKVALEKSNPVDGYPNLAQADVGSTISVNIKKEEAAKLEGKQSFSAVVKKVSGQEYFEIKLVWFNRNQQ